MTKSHRRHPLILLLIVVKPDLLSFLTALSSREVKVDKNTGRFIAVNLTDAEWHALKTVAPDPVAWVRSQIHRLLDESGVHPTLETAERHDAICTLELAD
jgi:hypothetical protein